MNTIAKSKTVDRVINTCVYDFVQIRAEKRVAREHARKTRADRDGQMRLMEICEKKKK